MRKIEYREIKRQKCPMCGCKNKVQTILYEDELQRKYVGYSLKCCACGHYQEFLQDVFNNGMPHKSYVRGESRCIKSSFCPHIDTCRLYTGPKPVRPDDGDKDDSVIDCDNNLFYRTVYVEPKKFK